MVDLKIELMISELKVDLKVDLKVELKAQLPMCRLCGVEEEELLLFCCIMQCRTDGEAKNQTEKAMTHTCTTSANTNNHNKI